MPNPTPPTITQLRKQFISEVRKLKTDDVTGKVNREAFLNALTRQAEEITAYAQKKKAQGNEALQAFVDKNRPAAEAFIEAELSSLDDE